MAARLGGRVGPTVWSEFGALASKLGDKVVNLGQGYPDFDPPAFVMEAARQAIESNCHQYTRPAGHPPLVELLAERYSTHLERPIDPMSEVAVTVGCSQALYVAMQSLIRPGAGDEVVLLEPFFDLYLGQISMAGGVPKFVPLRTSLDERRQETSSSSSTWELDFDLLERALTDRTRVLVLNSPHNPTGKVFTKAEMLKIAALLQRWPKVTVVSDEVYKYVVHGADISGPHVHFASLPGMFDRTLTLSSAGKTFSVTGWQVGWIVGPARLLKDVHTALPFLQFCASTPMQQALVGTLRQADLPYDGAENYYAWLCSQYQRKAALLARALSEAGLVVVSSQGGYFLTVNVSAVDVPRQYFEEDSEAISPMTKDWAFCRFLALEWGVVSIPVSPFFSPERRDSGEAGAFVRFAFCKSDATLGNAAEKLRAFGASQNNKRPETLEVFEESSLE